MPRIIDYKILYVTENDPQMIATLMEVEVKGWMRDGWEPLGGPAFGREQNSLYQAIGILDKSAD